MRPRSDNRIYALACAASGHPKSGWGFESPRGPQIQLSKEGAMFVIQHPGRVTLWIAVCVWIVFLSANGN